MSCHVTCYRRLGRGQIIGQRSAQGRRLGACLVYGESVYGLFSKMLQAFRYSTADSAHSNKNGKNPIRVREACCQSSEFMSFNRNAANGAVLLHYIPEP